MAKGSSKAAKNIAWGVYGIILVVVLGLVCWQIYRVSTGQVWSYGHDPVTEETTSTPKPTPTSDTDFKPADTQQVKDLMKLQAVENSELGGNKNEVTFRTQSGNIICTITKDMQKYPPSKWIPRGQTRDGKPLTGAGVVCSPYHYHQLTREDTVKCASGKGYTLGVAFATTDNDPAAPGACQEERWRINEYVNNMDAGKLTEKVLEQGFRAQLGHYSCAVNTLTVTCANLKTGKGFTFDDEHYKYF